MDPYMNRFTLLQTISLVYMLITVSCTRSSISHDEECLALFQFKQSIIHQEYNATCVGRGFQTFHSWKPRSNNASDAGFDCCSWYGVECSTDHVVGLDLSESFLCGHINSTTTLFSLVHLQKLNLATNNFYQSQIPSQISNLKLLRSLNLSGSGFNGQIPYGISKLMHLSSLDLSYNSLKLHNPSLKNLVQNLTRLEELDLSQVDISSSVPHFLANFSSLRSIVLYDCLLQNEFPKAILELPNLTFLDVSTNTNLTGSFPEFHKSSLLQHVDLGETGFFGIVPKSVCNLNHLAFLRLSKCNFSGHIPGSLSNLTQLTYLALGDNKFTDVVPSLVTLLKLNVLELNGNKFEKGQLPGWLGKLTKLSELHLFNMNIESEIPPFLTNLTKLSVLDMGLNSLSGHIPSWFLNLTQLAHIDLQGNLLEGPISSSFSSFQNLEYFNLVNNNFSGKIDLDTFLGLDKLQNLGLGFNIISLVVTNNYTNTTLPKLEQLQLSSCNLKEFPAFLRFQNKLRGLVLDRNKIDGMVPKWIWNNSQETLELIDLSHNFITGFHQHPDSLPWRRLQVFLIHNNKVRGQLPLPPQTTVVYKISDNNITGEIPPFICELKSLRLLDLSSNNMSGTLPPCFGGLSNSLVVLSLRQNNFHGVMMNAFVHESLLKNIDLSENGFTGQLPRSLVNCTKLEVLSLGDNSFHDVFPSWMGTLVNLQVLVLRSNKLYGLIQGSTTVRLHFPKLRIIDLSNNAFSGQLHQNYFQTWNAMKVVGEFSVMNSVIQSAAVRSTAPYTMTLIHKGVRTEYQKILTIFTAIDLSRNQFEGEIPSSVQNLRGLESLNLSYNQFTGRVLPSIGNLTSLESLDLSQNELSGEVPQQLVQLNFLSIFNVSFNHLEGRIPQGQQFSTFDNSSYDGNPELCGRPLSNECDQGSKGPRRPETSNTSSQSLFPSERIDWIFVFCGVGSGLVVGVLIGNFLYERYSDRSKMRKSNRSRTRKDRRVRPVCNIGRNQGTTLK